MDKISLEILKLLNINKNLNWYQFDVLIPFLDIEKFGESICYLQEEEFVKKSVLASNDDNDDYSFTFNTFLEITLKGKQF